SPAKGAVRVAGKRPRSGDPRAAISAGVAYVPEDRLGTGLSPGLSVASNFALKSYRQPSDSRGPFLRLRRIRERALELIDRDRIAVMYEGEVVGETATSEASIEEIGLLMAGGNDPRQD